MEHCGAGSPPSTPVQAACTHNLETYLQPLEPDFRNSDGAFLIHLAAYLYGVRLQFHDWWFDGRIPMKSTHHAFIRLDAERDFLSHSFKEWRAWEAPERKLFTNTLYLHSRSPTHQWDWERFNVNYTVFEALYRLAVRLWGLPEAGNHRERLYLVCNQFGIEIETENLDRIYDLRNPLVHEGLWFGQQPGTAIPDRLLGRESAKA